MDWHLRMSSIHTARKDHERHHLGMTTRMTADSKHFLNVTQSALAPIVRPRIGRVRSDLPQGVRSLRVGLWAILRPFGRSE